MTDDRRSKPRRSNCIIYAIQQFRYRGGSIVLRRTHFNKWRWLIWFHVGWKPPGCPKGGDCEGIEHYVPEKGEVKIFPPPWFKGHIKKGGWED